MNSLHLFSGSDDLSAKLWDVRTGQCIYGIQTHTCATVKFDEQKLVTGSFDNTIACWEWSTGAKILQFRGHTGAGWYRMSSGFRVVFMVTAISTDSYSNVLQADWFICIGSMPYKVFNWIPIEFYYLDVLSSCYKPGQNHLNHIVCD